MSETTCEQSLTYHVQLVLDNDYGSYMARREIVQDFLADQEEGEEPYVHQLADRLEDWAEELAGLEAEELGLFPREILSTALAWVDWTEIAEGYIAEENEAS